MFINRGPLTSYMRPLVQLYPFICTETAWICRHLWSLITLNNGNHSGTTLRDHVAWCSIPPSIYPGGLYRYCMKHHYSYFSFMHFSSVPAHFFNVCNVFINRTSVSETRPKIFIMSSKELLLNSIKCPTTNYECPARSKTVSHTL